jgi:phosphoglycerate dehydrogenase-like enzyme
VVGDTNLVPHRDRLEAALPDGVDVCWPDGAVAEELGDADVFVGGRFTAELAATAPRLRLVHAAGAGTDKIDFDALPPDALVANTFHHEQSMAEFVVAASVMLRRNFLEQDRALRAGRWATSVYDRSIAQPASLQGAVIGFVGFGHIGRRSWELFRAFGAGGVAVTGRGNLDAAAEGLRWAAATDRLTDVMAQSDVVVVSAPLTDQTEGMVGAAELAALGPRGVLINVGRGPLVVEHDLYEALSSRRIAAAAIDVWYRYPDATGYGAPSALPFADLPNVLMTPHSSGVTRDTFVGRVDDIAANIGRLHSGEPLHNLVTR